MPVGEQLPVEVVLNQQEIGVDVNTTGAMVTGAVIGGLVGGLIASGIANAQVKAAEERITPLRDQIISYDFNQRMEAALKAGLASEGISTAPIVTRVTTPWQMLRGDEARALPARAMVITPRYAIDAHFTTLKVSLQVQIVDRTVKSNGKPKGKVVFFRTYTFTSRIDDVDPDKNLQQWLALGGEDMMMLLDQGVRQVVDMVVFDFSAAGRAQWDVRPSSNPVRIGNNFVKGVMVVREAETYMWTRSGHKWMNFEGAQRIDVEAYRAARAARATQPAAVAVTPAAEAPAAEAAADAATGAAPADAQAAPAGQATP